MFLCNRIELKKERLPGHFFVARLVVRPLAACWNVFEGRRLLLINLFQLMSTFLLYVEQEYASVIMKMDEYTAGQYALN